MPKPLEPLVQEAHTDAPPFDAAARAGLKQWLDTWKRAGPLLEAERVARLRQLDETEAARIAVEWLWPLAPIGTGDAGEGLKPMTVALRQLAGQS